MSGEATIQQMCLDLARAEDAAIGSAVTLRIWARWGRGAFYRHEQQMYSARRKEVQERRAQLRALVPRAVFAAGMLRAYQQPHTQADDPPVDMTVGTVAPPKALPPH